MLGAIVLCALVALTAYACVAFPRDQGRIAPIWLAHAWVAAALLRTPARQWPLLIGAEIIGNMLANFWAGDPTVVGLGLSLCNTLECLTCALIVRARCGAAFDIGRIGHLIAFVFAAMAASMLSAGAAATLLDLVDHADFLRGLLVWAQADALGLEVHAGHGIDYETVKPVAAIPEVAELNIGHFLIGEAIFIGLGPAIQRMRALMDQARSERAA